MNPTAYREFKGVPGVKKQKKSSLNVPFYVCHNVWCTILWVYYFFFATQ